MLGPLCEWLESCLTSRKQFDTYNGIASVYKAIVCGVPQISVCIFIHINDQCAICKNTTLILFADDTNLFSNGTDLQFLESKINEGLVHIW